LKTWRIRQPRAQQPRRRRKHACPLPASLVAFRCDQGLRPMPGIRSLRRRDSWTLTTKPSRQAALVQGTLAVSRSPTVMATRINLLLRRQVVSLILEGYNTHGPPLVACRPLQSGQSYHQTRPRFDPVFGLCHFAFDCRSSALTLGPSCLAYTGALQAPGVFSLASPPRNRRSVLRLAHPVTIFPPLPNYSIRLGAAFCLVQLTA
jgi:hypothetical protein